MRFRVHGPCLAGRWEIRTWILCAISERQPCIGGKVVNASDSKSQLHSLGLFTFVLFDSQRLGISASCMDGGSKTAAENLSDEACDCWLLAFENLEALWGFASTVEV